MHHLRFLVCVLAFLCGVAVAAYPGAATAQTVTRIENTAQLDFSFDGETQSVASNTTVLSLSGVQRPTSLKFYRMSSGFNYDDLYCVAGPPSAIHGAAINAAQLATMPEDDGATDHSLGVVLDAPGENRNPDVRETATVQGRASTGESGNLILTETGPDTGVFAGGFSSTSPTGHAQACLKVFPSGTRFFISFTGSSDSLPSTDDILIDPFGHVFDSVTGLPVNGATVTLINDETGLPANVYGEDGVTPYPSTVISGQNVTASGGNLYIYGDGDYRFPFTEPGFYHIRVVPPSNYVAPSLVAPSALPAAPDGSTYVIEPEASYGRRFELFSPDPLEVNIPVDPLPQGTLVLQKTTSVREASPGDVIPYHLLITNPESAVMRMAVITDTLPAGLKYKRGTTNGVDEPTISADGRTLTFQLGDIWPNHDLDIRYAVEVMPNAPVGNAVNRAVSQIWGSPPSAEASATVRIKPLLMSDIMTIIGRVVEGDCATKGELKGVENVRILMEDGTYIVTDRDGLYHFEAVRKGRHVVQLDTHSLTAAHAPITCDDDTRWAQSATSRFVEGDGGSLKRVDFLLKSTGKTAEASEEKLPVTAVASDIAAGGRTNWLLGQKPGVDWLFPQVDHNPRAPALRVAIKHGPDQRIALSVNGDTTDPLAFDGTDKADDVAVSVWTGLPLREGDNHLEARVLDKSGRVVATLTHEKVTRKSDIDAWLVAGVQDWVVVGFAAGTAGFDTLSKNTHRYWVPKNRDVTTDGQISLYAKGRIKGEWLMTMAYDSDRKFDPQTGLLSGIDPDKYYTVYGDGTRQAYDAQSSRKLYLRLERKDAFVMFGDYETDMRESQLMRMNRTLNGVKAGYHGEHLSATAFAARSDQRFARDEIQGNGLSGPYRLSAGGLIANSDKITIETRDRFRSEKVITSTPMTRHIDYDIDADAGTITFRSPILSLDADLNPIFIVVDYEVEGSGDKRTVAGGRVAAKVADDRIELGVSVLRDEAQGKAMAAGFDLKAKLSEKTELRAELAAGGKQNAEDKNAYLLEVEHRGTNADVLAYVRHQDDGFGVGQQNFTESGTHKTGIDSQWRLNDKTSLTTSVWRQESTTGPQNRVVGDMKLEYKRTNGTVFIGATSAIDEGMATTSQTTASQALARQSSRLLSLGGSQTFFDKKLQLNGQVQFAVGDADDNRQFPVRNSVQAAYKINDSVRLVGGHEIANGENGKASTSRIGFDLKPWHGARLATTLNQLALGENGARSFAQYGLSQSLDLGKKWTIDATFDASQTLKGQVNPDALNPFQPVSVGTELNSDLDGSYTSATFGATYRATNWSWNGRLENRNSDRYDRKGVTSNLIRSLGEGKTVASSVRVYKIKDNQDRKVELASADISLAWRPLDSRWSVLERLEARHNRADAGVIGGNILGVPVSTGENQMTTRLINNISLNYRSDVRDEHGMEASVYYGAKHIRGKLADDSYDGFIDTIGFDVRQSLGSRFDVAFALSRQYAHDSKVKALSYGPSIGFSPKKDVWVSVGYNVSGYRDPDATAARYTQKGAYITARVKFDQGNLRRLF